MDEGLEKTFDLKIDTINMVPGNYRFDMLAFEQNEFGLQDFVDRIEGAAQIDLVKRNSTDLDWKSMFWGHTRYNDFHIIEIE